MLVGFSSLSRILSLPLSKDICVGREWLLLLFLQYFNFLADKVVRFHFCWQDFFVFQISCYYCWFNIQHKSFVWFWQLHTYIWKILYMYNRIFSFMLKKIKVKEILQQFELGQEVFFYSYGMWYEIVFFSLLEKNIFHVVLRELM